jgi:hypothetical protein
VTYVPFHTPVTSTKFGHVAIARPTRPERMYLFNGDPTTLRVSDWESPVPVLDQEDLIEQGISTNLLIPGAPRVDALGSCTCNGGAAHLGERLHAAGAAASVAAVAGQQLSFTDPVQAERFAICTYHAVTDLTGQPSEEWPPTDCGSNEYYVGQYFQRLNFIQGSQEPTTLASLLSLLQTGSVAVGGPWLNAWMTPNAQGFVDGDGSLEAWQAALASGVAGGHETLISAIEAIAMLTLSRQRTLSRLPAAPRWPLPPKGK